MVANKKNYHAGIRCIPTTLKLVVRRTYSNYRNIYILQLPAQNCGTLEHLPSCVEIN